MNVWIDSFTFEKSTMDYGCATVQIVKVTKSAFRQASASTREHYSYYCRCWKIFIDVTAKKEFSSDAILERVH